MPRLFRSAEYQWRHSNRYVEQFLVMYDTPRIVLGIMQRHLFSFSFFFYLYRPFPDFFFFVFTSDFYVFPCSMFMAPIHTSLTLCKQPVKFFFLSFMYTCATGYGGHRCGKPQTNSDYLRFFHVPCNLTRQEILFLFFASPHQNEAAVNKY